MSEQSSTGRQQQFDLLVPIAKEAAGETWIRNEPSGTFTVWRLIQTEPYTTYSEKRSYWRWQTSDPDQINTETHLDVYPTWEPISIGYGKRNGARLSLPYLTSLFLRRAVNVDELIHYMQPLVAHTAQNKDVTTFGEVPNDLIAKSLRFPDNPLLIPDSALIASLKSMEPGDTRLSGTIADKIGKFLMGNMQSRTSVFIDTDLAHQQSLLDMLGVLDEHQLVPASFWYVHGVRGGLVFKYPSLLETTVSKLSTPEGIKAVKNQRFKQPLTVITSHVNNLLEHYAKDENRDQARIRDAIKTINTPVGRTILGQLISIGQGVTLGMNRELTTRYSADEEDLLSNLDPTQTVQAGEALFRILEIIRLPGLEPKVALQQQEEDSLHTALIETLHIALLKGTVRRQAGDMRLRFPEENIHELMGELPKGQFPSQVAAFIRRKNRKPESPVRGDAHHIQKPGSGLLS